MGNEAPKVVLLVSAVPRDAERLRVDREMQRVQELRYASTNRDQFEVHFVQAATVNKLQAALQRHRPELVHFCGHGRSGLGILLEDTEGNSQVIPSSVLAAMFRLMDGTVRCVVLNACFADEQAKVLVQHVDYVVGIRGVIGDDHALHFSEAFYGALFESRDYPACYEWAATSLQAVAGSSVEAEFRTRRRESGQVSAKSTSAPGHLVETAPPSAETSEGENSRVVPPTPPRGPARRRALGRYAALAAMLGLAAWAGAATAREARSSPPTASDELRLTGVYWEEAPHEVDRELSFGFRARGTTLFVYKEPDGRYSAVEMTTWEIYYYPEGRPESERLRVGGYTAEWKYTESPGRERGSGTIKMNGRVTRRFGLELEGARVEQMPTTTLSSEYKKLIQDISDSHVTVESTFELEQDGVIRRSNVYNGHRDTAPDVSKFLPQQ